MVPVQRSSGPGRLVATLTSGGRTLHEVRGGWATQATDFTAKIALSGLAPGRGYDVALRFEDEDGNAGEVGNAHFATAAVHPASTSFVWTGDTCGQGWGINPDLGRLLGYRAMHTTHPDFFVHAGDTVYADGPIQGRGHRAGGTRVAQRRHRRGRQGRRRARRVPGAAPVHADGRQHPGDVRRGAMRVLGCSPAERIEADRQATLPLPPVPPITGWRSSWRLPRDHYIRLDSNDYSVHPTAVGRRIEVTADLDRVRVFCDGRAVADHARCWAKHQSLTDPAHAQAAKALRHDRLAVVAPPVTTEVEQRPLSS